MHPYKIANGVDQYYVELANVIYHQLEIDGFADIFDKKKDAKHLALCLAAYFEDVISQTNIWETFTEECKRRYGKFIPQYRIMDEQVLNLK